LGEGTGRRVVPVFPDATRGPLGAAQIDVCAGEWDRADSSWNAVLEPFRPWRQGAQLTD